MTLLIKFKKYYTEPNYKYNIVSCCIFLLEKSYKDVYIYYNGLVNIVKNFKKLLPNYYLRIYFDESIIYTKYKTKEHANLTKNYWIPFIEKLKQINFVQLIKLDCMKLKKNKYSHYGLFMTLSRFCPLFYDNKLINHIVFIDIDSGLSDIKKIKDTILPYYKKYNPIICYISRLGFYLKKRHLPYPYGMNANGWISKCIFNKKIFENFLLNIYNRKLDKDLIEKLVYKSNPTNLDELFIYGIDEYFLNYIFLKYCFKNNIYSICVINNQRIINLLYKNRFNLYKLQNNDLKLLNFLLKKLLGKFYNKSNTAKENIELFNTLILNNNRNKIVIYLLKNIKKYIPLLKKEDYSKLFIHEEYLNMIQRINFLKYHNKLLIIKSKTNKYLINK